MSSDEAHASSDSFNLGGLGGAWQPAPVGWKILDQATARREWAALAEWVRWLVGRYALTPRTVPPSEYEKAVNNDLDARSQAASATW